MSSSKTVQCDQCPNRFIKVVHNQPEAPEEEAQKTSAEDSSSVSDSQEPSETPAP